MADINNNEVTELNLDTFFAEVGNATVGTGGRRGKDVRAFEFLGGFVGADMFREKLPAVSVASIKADKGKLYYKYTDSMKPGELANLGCWRLTGNVEVIGTDGVRFDALSYLAMPADTRPEVRTTGKVEIERVAFKCELPVVEKLARYKEMWSLDDLAKTSVPVQHLIDHLARLHKATVNIVA